MNSWWTFGLYSEYTTTHEYSMFCPHTSPKRVLLDTQEKSASEQAAINPKRPQNIILNTFRKKENPKLVQHKVQWQHKNRWDEVTTFLHVNTTKPSPNIDPVRSQCKEQGVQEVRQWCAWFCPRCIFNSIIFPRGRWWGRLSSAAAWGHAWHWGTTHTRRRWSLWTARPSPGSGRGLWRSRARPPLWLSAPCSPSGLGSSAPARETHETIEC